MTKNCIGIISYFPDNEKRSKRMNALSYLLYNIEKLFKDIDIIIITQNWKEYTCPKISNKIITFDYNKPLGILKARRVLREKFLRSEYDNLIMLDDDCILTGYDTSVYLKELEDHPNSVGIFSDHLLKLLAISKWAYYQIDMPDLDAEKYEGFEDRAFIENCMSKFECFKFTHSDKLDEISYGFISSEYPSLWWDKEARSSRSAMVAATDNNIIEFRDCLTDPIDIVVTYVNKNDKLWEEQYKKYIKEIKVNEDFTGDCRYRNWDFFNYWFRSVEKNCKWANNIFLIVQSDSQLPEWLNTDNPRLKIIHHEDYIPNELLPTFNSNTIELFIPRIKELSQHYILCNDDTFFLNTSNRYDFFRARKPVYQIRYTSPKYINSNNDFHMTLDNNMRIEEAILGQRAARHHHFHLQDSRDKKFELDILNKYWDAIYNSVKVSRFRHTSNLTQYLYTDLMKFLNIGINDEMLYSNSSLIILRPDEDINKYSDNRLVCINDTCAVDFSKKQEVLDFLDKKFPDKSLFEK